MLVEGLDEPVAPVVDPEPATEVVELVRLRRRTPIGRARYLAEERARLVAAGASTTVLDLAEQAMRDTDVDNVEALTGWVMRMVSGWCRDNRDALFELPMPVAQRLVVQAAVGYLLANGLVRTVRPQELAEQPAQWREVMPEHLVPDPTGELLAHRDGRLERMRAAAERRQGQKAWFVNARREPAAVDVKEPAGSVDGGGVGGEE